tara:strand:- start:1516 stop:1839 length:324 start_codon:yes stop_codon:yes gene_type:complete
MEDKFVTGLGIQRPVGNKIIRKMNLDKDYFSGKDCIEYFNLRSNYLRNKMEEIFSGQYKFRDYGNEHIFESFNNKYSVHYSLDDEGVFEVTEIIPKSNLVDKIENDC